MFAGVPFGGAAFASTGSTGVKHATSTVAITGGGTLTVTATRQAPATITLSGGGAITTPTPGIRTTHTTLPLSGGGTLDGYGRHLATVAWTLSGGGTLTATGWANPVLSVVAHQPSTQYVVPQTASPSVVAPTWPARADPTVSPVQP
jgi:hypothetical protein